MSPSPIPQPAEQKCPNCGTMAPKEFALCPRCGMSLSAPSKTIYGCATVLFQVVLIFVALGFGASGACFIIMGVGTTIDYWWLLLIGAVLLGLAALCIWGTVRIGKSRQ